MRSLEKTHMSGLSKSDELKNALHKGVQSLSNIFKPVPVVSCFMEQGKLTPEEVLINKIENLKKNTKKIPTLHFC